MPELPEVEITRRSIAPLLLERRIRRVRTTEPSTLFLTPPALLRRRLAGRRVVQADRRGKYLLFWLDDRSMVLIHLGMTGQLISSTASSPRLFTAAVRDAARRPSLERRFEPDQHTHVCIELEGGGPHVYFRDIRKFGKIEHLLDGQGSARLRRLGPDALAVTPEIVAHAAERRRTPIKSFLLDQSVLAGVGNIYADEALYLAGIRPLRPARKLGARECERLAGAVKGVLERAIALGGSSISDFVHPDGADGGFQHARRVYAREGEPCGTCGAVIRRVVIAQRSAHYCPACQR